MLAALLGALCLQAAYAQAPAPARSAPAAAAPAPAPAQISRDAQRAYETTRDKLVQIRTLLRNSNTQASVGSGFFVSANGLIITNFHVASQLALEPERYRGVYVPVDGKEAEVELLAFDVRNDLALLRVKTPAAGATPQLAFRGADRPLARACIVLRGLGHPELPS